MAASNIFKRFYRFSKFVWTMYILTVKYGLTNKQNLWNILRTDGNLRNNLPNMRLPRIFRFVIKKPVDPCENQWHHRSCRLEVFCRKGIVRNFAKFTGKHLHQILFLKKVADVRPATLLKRLWYRCFPVNFKKFLRTSFFYRTLVPASGTRRAAQSKHSTFRSVYLSL